MSQSNPVADSKSSGPKSFARRDHLRSVEIKVQKKWEAMQVYESNIDESREKYLITFPYPYMNGRLHLGHAFSMTKVFYHYYGCDNIIYTHIMLRRNLQHDSSVY